MSEANRNRCSYWMPVIERVIGSEFYPKTAFIGFDWKRSGVSRALALVFGDHPKKLKMVGRCIEESVRKHINSEPYPFWLRSNLISGKHTFPDATGRITSFEDILFAFCAITEHASEALWLEGDDGTDVWVVREFIEPASKFTAYRGHPVGPEWRLIVRDGVVTEESGLYWPFEAIKDTARWNAGPPVDQKHLETIIKNMTAYRYPPDLDAMSIQVASALGGDWSVDWMRGANGSWYLIDMAEADRSWIPNPV